MKGKVVLCTIDYRKSLEGTSHSWLAVGKPRGDYYFQWWEWKPGLAPSSNLVTETRSFNNMKGIREGWFERYTQKLIEEWFSRQDFHVSYSNLIKILDSGENVAVACYCAPSKREFCHLSILRKVLEESGYQVEEAEPIGGV